MTPEQTREAVFQEKALEAFAAHAKAMTSTEIVNCEMCVCGMHTTTRQTDLCRQLKELIRKETK